MSLYKGTVTFSPTVVNRKSSKLQSTYAGSQKYPFIKKRTQPIICEAAVEDQKGKQVQAAAQPSQQQEEEYEYDDELEEPAWIRNEKIREARKQAGNNLPYWLYLIFSAPFSIAGVGILLELKEKKAIFGKIKFDTLFYYPTVIAIAAVSIPLALYFYRKGLKAFNLERKMVDRMDGFDV